MVAGTFSGFLQGGTLTDGTLSDLNAGSIASGVGTHLAVLKPRWYTY